MTATLIKEEKSSGLRVTKRADGSVRAVKDCSFSGRKSLTNQSDAKHADVNYIVRKAVKSGFLETMDARKSVYGDFSSGEDFLDAQNRIARFTAMFENFPAHIKTRCKNNPAEFIDFLGKEENFDEAVELGILPKKKREEKVQDDGSKIILVTEC